MKITPLDRLFSEYIRKRAISRVNGCERCLTEKYPVTKEDGSEFPAWKQLQCSHYWGRVKKSTRWDEDDAAGLCPGCHMHLEAHPLLHTEWFEQYLGDEKFEYLRIRALKPSKPDENLITIYLKERLEALR